MKYKYYLLYVCGVRLYIIRENKEINTMTIEDIEIFMQKYDIKGFVNKNMRTIELRIDGDVFVFPFYGFVPKNSAEGVQVFLDDVLSVEEKSFKEAVKNGSFDEEYGEELYKKVCSYVEKFKKFLGIKKYNELLEMVV